MKGGELIMENSVYKLSCAVGCDKLKVAFILDGAKGKTKSRSFPLRDAVVAECMATVPPTEMARFEGLAPDGRPDSFRPSNAIYMLDNLYLKPCVALEEKNIIMSDAEQNEAYAQVKEQISETRKA